ncbi:MAG: response regulator [Desulfuromonadales bacterium]
MNINRLDQNYLKNLTVLYVEDDLDTREQFSEFLRRPVGTLITAANGAEGLEAFVKHSPDIVVTDILMPYMDGLAMASEIRGISPTVPIIVITAFEQTDYLMRAINLGIDKYVIKPVNSYLLFECLLECAHRLRAEDQLALLHEREMQEMSLKHHKIVAKLAGGMAHDYNNLLQAILGFASLAKMKLEPGSESSEHLEQVDKCFTEARDLGKMLLLLGEDNSEYMQHGPILPLFQYTIQAALMGSGITFNLDLPEVDPPINFMENQMHLVFSSLTTNALEAMPSGGTLSLSAQSTTITDQDLLPLVPGTYLHIALTDSGTGIPPEIMPKIFDLYFSTKQRCSQRGMGLSLALCHTIIMKHNGIITAESAPESGTTFDIWLPIAI